MSLPLPPMTDAEIAHLRVRIVALEGLVIGLLAEASQGSYGSQSGSPDTSRRGLVSPPTR